ncbi:carboxymuconolactone decarboxylase family protein [Novosphingobium guangzhouense]|uniref:carboxymuconolactone decarboxylase family protein n=1 Tax=Novosphingobium guangzhouense TaxID=1850347 RepID=UPI001474783F|nr:carboxymuconolactone decarboxylase family protein [Novosphingobium guangzhouense]
MKTEAEKQAFKHAYIEARGYWAEFNDGLLEYSPEWLEAYLAYSSSPACTGPLSARMRELIYVAVDGSTTHLFQAGLEVHIRIALDIGCSAAELVEVLQIATMQGLDSVAMGMDVLVQELAARGTPLAGPQDWLSAAARVSPEWASALANLQVVAERTSRLTPCERALIRLALAASPTHLNERAVRIEVREALDAGASAEEIAQVFQLVAHLGLHACTDGIPAVMRAVAEPKGD